MEIKIPYDRSCYIPYVISCFLLEIFHILEIYCTNNHEWENFISTSLFLTSEMNEFQNRIDCLFFSVLHEKWEREILLYYLILHFSFLNEKREIHHSLQSQQIPIDNFSSSLNLIGRNINYCLPLPCFRTSAGAFQESVRKELLPPFSLYSTANALMATRLKTKTSSEKRAHHSRIFLQIRPQLRELQGTSL